MKKNKRDKWIADNNPQYYYCDCGTELLRLSDDSYEFEDGTKVPSGINISIYVSHSWRSLKDRLSHCWNIIKYGDPWRDHIILNMVSAEELANDILKRVDAVKKHHERKRKS